MKPMTNKSGFTLLEIIIVVIIVGVLASLALPKFFSTVEFSRAQEALSAVATMRGSLERYYIQNNGTYVGATTATIDTGDPLNGQSNAHFVMTITAPAGINTYTIVATRNTVDNGDVNSNIITTQNANTVVRAGATAFSKIK